MKTRIIVAVLLATIFISSCTVLSFYPLYTEKELIRDDRIVGTWESYNNKDVFPTAMSKTQVDTMIWEISFQKEIWKKKINNPFDRGSEQIPNRFTYTLRIYDKAAPANDAEFHLHIVKLDDKLFIDLFPEEWQKNNTILAVHLIGVHTFAKLEIGKTLEINWFDSDLLQKLLDENKIRIKHENNGVYNLLTAKPEELQKFVIKYANEGKAFDESMKYTLNKK
ncbi:MAG TPA: hypothetical protein DIW31_11015 [Bacteroidales bacterium]|nr:hypothetical protein [Bacteroidales bacterium]